MKPENMKKAYEWILTPSKGDDIVLTENQYAYYRDAVKIGDMSAIFFDDVEVRPPHIITALRREASVTKNKYPCMKCDTNGFLLEKDRNGVLLVCPECEGTGLKLK